MIKVTDAILKECIRKNNFTVKKIEATQYLMKFNFNEIVLRAICTIKPQDIHVDFEENDNISVIGMFRHSIVASALLDYLDK